MNNNKKTLTVVGIALVAVVLGFFHLNSDDGAYKQEIEDFWKDRIAFLKTSAGSPFVRNNQPYEPISYFEANRKYRVNASLDRFTKREVVAIAHSDGTNSNYLKFAYAYFKLEEKQYRLLVLKALGFGHNYLTAFGDGTSGISTYGGGRYLDLNMGKSNDIIIDFNKAYFPYCAYVDDFACPLPPKENLLTVAIEAGEKN